ncbi:four-carbon acid sugar kinase family protein [Thermithiobacillus plumbiphilus]|uniref:Four-carbon acid sugar kinase family protein n=1 Tax=Thermithiobacillus plumbiphilus TaxID=1729899 RepID=A0ABU9DAC5_9PROT
MTTRIIVLDDDPTGSQTVHGCLLLTRWNVATLREALADASPLFFVLTNTRGMDAERAAAITREVCRNLKAALAGSDIQPVLVSRSDSTLRGHYPVETDVIAEELGPFDAHFLVPAFFEGGRTTRDSVHYLRVNGVDVPVHETEFAKDSVFGYQHSYLPDYVAEKTQGRIPASAVRRFTLEDIRAGVREQLLHLENNACCVVDAEVPDDLARFTQDVLAATRAGKRFLFRSAASLLTALAQLPPQPVAAEAMGQYTRKGRPGAVIVGSHVAKSSRQLALLLEAPGVAGVEVDVSRLPDAREMVLAEVLDAVERHFAAGKTAVVYTSRTERQFADQAARLAFGEAVSNLLMDVVCRLPEDLGFLISKGGITSNEVLSSGLALRSARVLGQVAAGVSVVRCPAEHPRFPELPVVIFPGNVGEDDTLALVYQRFAGLQDFGQQPV